MKISFTTSFVASYYAIGLRPLGPGPRLDSTQGRDLLNAAHNTQQQTWMSGQNYIYFLY